LLYLHEKLGYETTAKLKVESESESESESRIPETMIHSWCDGENSDIEVASLILVLAVRCSERARFVAEIRKLTENVQKILMYIIESRPLLHKTAPTRAPSDSNFSLISTEGTLVSRSKSARNIAPPKLLRRATEFGFKSPSPPPPPPQNDLKIHSTMQAHVDGLLAALAQSEDQKQELQRQLDDADEKYRTKETRLLAQFAESVETHTRDVFIYKQECEILQEKLLKLEKTQKQSKELASNVDEYPSSDESERREDFLNTSERVKTLTQENEQFRIDCDAYKFKNGKIFTWENLLSSIHGDGKVLASHFSSGTWLAQQRNRQNF
jgi:myosin heavy subunit